MPTFANREALSSVRAKINSAIERIDAYGVPSILSYATLAEFQAAVTAGLTMADGLPVVAAGGVYVADSTAAITGLPAGWRNAGYVYTYAQVEAWATAFQAGSQYIVVNEDGYYVAYERDPTAASTDLTTAFGEAFIKRGLGATDLATLAADVANSIRQNAVSGIGTYGGTADAFTLTVGSGYAVFPTRYTIKFRASATNTGAATVAVDGLPAVALRTVTGVALPAGYIRTDVDTEITFDGTYWVADRAAERGGTDASGFERLANGTMKVWKRLTGLGPVSTAAGSNFVSTTINVGALAATFAAVPYRSITPFNSTVSAGASLSIAPTVSDGGSFALFRSTTSALTDFGADCVFEGRWF